MNIKDLQYVIAVAETHHFGRAAERCHVSQPTLSGQLKKLEESLGITLFERTNRSVEITPIGEAVVEHAYRILEQTEAITQLAAAHQDPLAGPLRLGVIPTLSPYLMPLILAPLKQNYPQLKLILSEEMTDSLLNRLHHHELDAALLATSIDEPSLQSIPLFNEPFWLAHPQNHPLSSKKKLTSADLDSTDLLLLAEGHCLAKQAMEVCHLKHRVEQGELADLRAASLETLLQLVAAGFGATLVPALAISSPSCRDENIRLQPLNFPNAHRKVSLVFRASFPRRQVLDAFAALVQSRLPSSVKILGMQ